MLIAHAGGAHPPRADRAHTRVPLAMGGEQVGELVVAHPTRPQLDAHTTAVLALVASPLSQALRGDRLTQALSAQRAAAVTALEEERRRLRRDLHDGLGPVLTGIAYGVDAARNWLGSEPERAEQLLAHVREDTSMMIAEVRRLVVGLRPPSLDERGLAEAVRAHVAHLPGPGGSPLPVGVVATGPLQGLPAGVEVAVFRIAVEAVTNAARHARAARAQVELEVTDAELRVTVTDVVDRDVDGPAAGLPWLPGVGLTSMRERCEQLHGSFSAGPTPTGGRVRATFPLIAAASGSGQSHPPAAHPSLVGG